jgi:hypothetical protein
MPTSSGRNRGNCGPLTVRTRVPKAAVEAFVDNLGVRWNSEELRGFRNLGR